MTANLVRYYSVEHRRGCEVYLIFFRSDMVSEAVRQVGRWAASKDLRFTWYDAAMMAPRIRAVQGPSRIIG